MMTIRERRSKVPHSWVRPNTTAPSSAASVMPVHASACCIADTEIIAAISALHVLHHFISPSDFVSV
jgi:hypothetical protein